MTKTMKYEGKYGTLEICMDYPLGYGYKPEVYCTELNLDGELTKSNVSALLKWKDRRRLAPCNINSPNFEF